MTGHRRSRFAGTATAVMLVLVAIVLSGCLPASGSKAKSGGTAQGSLSVARSALATTAPDAKLLVVQTAQAVLPTASPVWGYLFGSPSTDKTYMVYVSSGQSMGAQEYGTAGLSASEWPKVPGTDSWKVDSDAAYAKALALSGAKGQPAAYMMGMVTYKPVASTSTIEPFVWSVQFEPGASGATTRAIDVNAMTGATSLSKRK